MRKLFVSMLAIAALASCAKEETIVADQGELIGFNSFVENSTRANDPSYSNKDIESFKVYGTVNGGAGDVLIYPGTVITKDADYGEAWNCPVEQYWIAGATYKFVGIVDGDKLGVTETTCDNGMPTTISYIADGKTDLLCQTINYTAKTAEELAVGETNDIVGFTFTHLLSKVNFIVNNNVHDSAKDYIFVARDITFTGATEGIYTITYPTTTGALVGGSWAISASDDIELDTLEIAYGTKSVDLTTAKLFIPGVYTIDFAVDIYFKEVKAENLVTTLDFDGANPELVANNSYDFNVTVDLGSPIEFTVTKKPEWTENDPELNL